MRWPWQPKSGRSTTFRLRPFDPESGRIAVGKLVDGRDAVLNIGDTSGVVIGGVPGSGKTAGMMTIVLALHLSGRCRIHVIDGKGGDDWSWIQPFAASFVRDDIDSVHENLLELDKEMRLRLSSMRRDYGGSNYWNLAIDKRPPLEVIIIDECQTFFDAKGILGGKAAKDKAVEITAAAIDIVKKGRSAGYVLFALTQKPTTDSLPSSLRDNCGVRICFRVTTTEAARAVLGTMPEGSPSPVDIPQLRRGGAVIGLEDGTAVMCRFAYIPEKMACNSFANGGRCRYTVNQHKRRKPSELELRG